MKFNTLILFDTAQISTDTQICRNALDRALLKYNGLSIKFKIMLFFYVILEKIKCEIVGQLDYRRAITLF